jgi:hypothetical protein
MSVLNRARAQVSEERLWYNMYGQAKLELMSQYHFCIAFENSRHPDYITEKVFQALAAGCIPLYDGAPNAHELLPHKSFIDRRRFGTAAEMGRYLRHLIDSPSEYAEYVAWRSDPAEVAKLEALASLGSDSGWCRLCQLLQAETSQRPLA